MQGWIEGFQESIDFIERNLTDELDIEVIAAKAALSPFYYQRIFGALCGVTVGEYIRARRMTRNQAFFEEFVSININQRGRIDNEAQNISGRGCYIHL